MGLTEYWKISTSKSLADKEKHKEEKLQGSKKRQWAPQKPREETDS